MEVEPGPELTQLWLKSPRFNYKKTRPISTLYSLLYCCVAILTSIYLLINAEVCSWKIIFTRKGEVKSHVLFFFFFRGNEHNFLAVFVQSSRYLGCGFSLDLSFNTVLEIKITTTTRRWCIIAALRHTR